MADYICAVLTLNPVIILLAVEYTFPISSSNALNVLEMSTANTSVAEILFLRQKPGLPRQLKAV